MAAIPASPEVSTPALHLLPVAHRITAGDWKLSRYTHIIPAPSGGGGVVYNGNSGAVAEFSQAGFEAAQQLASIFARATDSAAADLPDSLTEMFHHFQAGGFCVRATEDEIASLEERYRRERERSQFLFTVLPTFACNLGCDYCFVGKKKGVMDLETQDHLIDFARAAIEKKAPPNMFVDWFGGEPLLAPAIIERLSAEFIRICDAHGVPYGAQVITNGTLLSPRVVEMLQRSRVDRLQITLDGPPEIHDLRRPYHSGRGSSFGRIVEGLERAAGKFLIRLRINVDVHNLHSVWPLLEFFESKGWLGPDTGFYPYLARVSAFTDACSGFAGQVTTLDEFFEVQFQWMERLRELGVPIADQGLYQFPEPKKYNCGAVGENGFVFTPDGEIHKCGLEVDHSASAAGQLGRGLVRDSPQFQRFATYTPFENEVCRECEYLPTCLGGCPRDRLTGKTVEIKNNCDFHKKFERQLLMFHLGHRPPVAAARMSPVGTPPRTQSLFPILQ